MADKKISDQDVSAIDKALAAAKARKAQKASTGEVTVRPAREPKSTEPRAPKAPRVTDEEKAAKNLQRETERNARKATRDAARQEKIAARNAGKQPAHMRKVQKAAEKLSALGQSAQLLFNEATTNLTASELAVLALHIQHFNRVSATERALNVEIKEGSPVQIISGDPRFIGKTGTVVKAQRIRCYVNIPGANNRPVPGTDSTGIYFFTSDVQASVAAETPADLTEAVEATG